MALARSLSSSPSSTLSVGHCPRPADGRRPTGFRSPIDRSPPSVTLTMIGGHGRVVRERSALSLPGRPLPARVPVCECPRGGLAAAPGSRAPCCGSSFCGMEGGQQRCRGDRPCRAKNPRGRASEVAAKAKWARDRKNGTFGSTDNCGGGATSSRGDEEGGERHSIPRVRSYASDR